MPILPVLDIMQGEVVRGVAGRRADYRPIVSNLTSSCAPRDVALALHSSFGFTEFYVADLDAIAGAAPAWAIYSDLIASGFGLWVDAGIRTARDADALAIPGIARIIAGLETIAGPMVLRQIGDSLGHDRIVFSLDLKNGAPLGNSATWNAGDAWTVAEQAIANQVGGILVLDISRVGLGAGTGTEELCSRLRREHAGLSIATGGGVRGPDDVHRLHCCGVDHILVASALHDGRIRSANEPKP